MDKHELKGIAERKLDHMRFGCFRGSLNHFLETGTINGSFLEAINSLITECEGKDVSTSEKDLRVCNVSVSLLIRMKEFIDNAIFNHNADAAPMHINDYKKSVKLSKQLARQLIKCNGR